MKYAQYSAYFTEKFWSDHVYVGDEELAKKSAERIYQRRDVSISSVLEMGVHPIRVLVSEIRQRQDEYGAAPGTIFTSRDEYAYWERRGQRAKRLGPAHFKYAVKKELECGANSPYKIHHFEGVA